MDTGRGYMEEIPEDIYQKAKQQKLSGVFLVGEVVEIHGSKFKIKAIGAKEMRLRVLKSEPLDEIEQLKRDVETAKGNK